MGMIGTYLRVTDDELARLLDEPDYFEELYTYEERQSDIDKAWHGLYFLLTGEADLDDIDRHSLGRTIFGGMVIEEETGTAYLTSTEVKDLTTRLHYIERDALESRYDTTRMNAHELYPFERGWGSEEKQYLLEQFEELKAIFSSASQKQEGLITWIG